MYSIITIEFIYPLFRGQHVPTSGRVCTCHFKVAYKLKQKKKKAMGNEMKFGINIAAPFVGMKREEGSEYPFSKQVRPCLLLQNILCLECRFLSLIRQV